VSDLPGDRIEIRSLRVAGVHGVLAEERVRPQPFEVDADLYVDCLAAGRSDQLADTVDYAAVVDRLVEAVRSTSFALLEALADRLVREALDVDPRIGAVEVAVRKLAPPIEAEVVVGVRIARRRDGS
jgi:dihydroneopterin aldolase